jgi:hypothetical protein
LRSPFGLFRTINLTEFLQGFFDGELSARQLLQNVEIRGGVCEIFIESGGDGVEAILDGGVADVEKAFHFFEGAVVADEGDDKGLVVRREFAEGGEFEVAVEGELAGKAGQASGGEWGFAVGAEGFGDVHIRIQEREQSTMEINKVKWKIHIIKNYDKMPSCFQFGTKSEIAMITASLKSGRETTSFRESSYNENIWEPIRRIPKQWCC